LPNGDNTTNVFQLAAATLLRDKFQGKRSFPYYLAFTLRLEALFQSSCKTKTNLSTKQSCTIN
jgi:hypothetical protein